MLASKSTWPEKKNVLQDQVARLMSNINQSKPASKSTSQISLSHTHTHTHHFEGHTSLLREGHRVDQVNLLNSNPCHFPQSNVHISSFGQTYIAFSRLLPENLRVFNFGERKFEKSEGGFPHSSLELQVPIWLLLNFSNQTQQAVRFRLS
uniref:Uncharacterized protein n=1 Tax=Micrurus corallinus TaxID=54390 RepID=A0A2D4ETC2_MICCO